MSVCDICNKEMEYRDGYVLTTKEGYKRRSI
jgi:hypothetical protein